tara:strand:- start:659 stop:1108 length:450 start_codon:yes stop_codon:yes gene_type:complete
MCKDIDLKISDHNSNFLLYLALMGVVLFFIIRDINQNEGFNAPISYRLKARCPIPGKNNVPLFKNVTTTAPTGSEYLNFEDIASYSFPTVDGQKNSPHHLFTLANNQFKPECCPSTYSTSTGCMCRNQIQDKFIQSRGMNKSLRTQPDI